MSKIYVKRIFLETTLSIIYKLTVNSISTMFHKLKVNAMFTIIIDINRTKITTNLNT